MPSNKISTKININKDDSSLNDFLFLWSEFGSRPNKIFLHGDFSKDLVKKIENFEIVNVFREISFESDSDIQNDKVICKVSDNVYLSYIEVDKLLESTFTDITIFYKSNSDSEVVGSLLQDISEYLLCEPISEKTNFYITSLSQTSLEMINLPIKKEIEDIKILYEKNTWKESNKILKKIKSGDAGLAILFGERGLGKSSFINHIVNVVDRDVIFVPNTMIEICINSTDFRKILDKFNKPIVVIDDCETIFSDFFTKSNLLCNNLLQLIDGVVAIDDLTVVAIFNVEDEDEIDQNLIGCNSLIGILEFMRLNKNESQSLSKILKTKNKFTKDSRLVDVIRDKIVENKGKLGF